MPLCQNKRIGAAIISFCVVYGISCGNLLAVTPQKTLEATIDHLQTILHDANLGADARKKQIRELIFSRIDCREMSKRILGSYWNQNPTNQDDFVVAFTGFMERTFFNKVEKIRDVKVSYQQEEIQGPLATIMMNMHTSASGYHIKVHMHESESGWKIYDLTLEDLGFSLVRSYRAQLQRVLQQASFQELLEIIAAKNMR